MFIRAINQKKPTQTNRPTDVRLLGNHNLIILAVFQAKL